MTAVQRLTIALSEQREKINGLLNQPEADRGENYETELREATDLISRTEVEYRAAVAAEPNPVIEPGQPTDPETRERLKLRDRSAVGAFLLAEMQGRELGGAEAEYRSALGIKAGIPLDLWETPPETRADAATPVPASGTGATLAPIQPALFAPSIAGRLGIDMPRVGSGAFTEATITTSLTAATKAKGAAQESTAATLTPATANPRRISARLTLQIEDIAAIGVGNYDAALRQNLSLVLSDQYDNQAINGNGTAPNVTGLIKQLTDPTDPTAIADFDAFLKAYADHIDGLWASMLSEVAIVGNVDAYKLSARSFRDHTINETGAGAARAAAARGDVSFADYAKAHTAGWWTNKRMPATASHIAAGIVYRTGRAGVRTACHPVWDAITVDDIYTDSAKGQRHVTMHVLVGDKVLLVQPDAYARVDFKVSS